MNKDRIQKIIDSKKNLVDGYDLPAMVRKEAEEGGCGVVGFCCTEPVRGKHIYEPSKQMHNRGNGKGGGIAAVGFVPEELGVSRDILDNCYMLHIALLEPDVKNEIEKEFIYPYFDVASSSMIDKVDDWTSVPGLEVKPPDVCRYFVRVKKSVLDGFIEKNKFQDMPGDEAEEEFINQNTFRLNQVYYSSLGDKKAFVLSHGKNIMILKVVGFAEAIVDYYKIRDLKAHVWIAHQRFPTKGRVWHPAGAHPFTGINMALVHNGDFANYHSFTEYLLQRNIRPQFLTDTEVSALMFDLMDRTYHYSLEHIIEALAPTTELDFDRLPEEKQKIYRAIQATHIHGSPDGPWFFIIARNHVEEKKFQLLGITDTAMLRPQVFAFCDGEVQVGLIGSEKQAIDATLLSMSEDDRRICPVADKYWNARGGSHTDGGAFIFNVCEDSGKMRLTCTDKFGRAVTLPAGTDACDFTTENFIHTEPDPGSAEQIKYLCRTDSRALGSYVIANIPAWSFDDIRSVLRMITDNAADSDSIEIAVQVLTMLNDLRYPTGSKKRSSILHIVRTEITRLFKSIPYLNDTLNNSTTFRLIDFKTADSLRAPENNESVLIINSFGFPPEGPKNDASLLMNAYMAGWKRFIAFGCTGQRYIGNGLGPDTHDVVIDAYDSTGDYFASGIDGMTINVHNNAQDQLGQIIKDGKLVIYGDVGQTFLYGAKGGEIYVMGNAAGRPLINSVGKPRVVINGTCLDFLGESFMAGDPYNDGGFIILNGIYFDDNGNVVLMHEPYPGSNIFSLASGGAVYIRDPEMTLVEQQLNGGVVKNITKKDWELILPYLAENERLFNIRIEDLLKFNGKVQNPLKIYRKVIPVSSGAVDYEEVTEEEVLYEPEPANAS